MPKVFVVLSFISAATTFAILVTPVQTPEKPKQHTPISMQAYFNQRKNSAAAIGQKSTSSFASIIVAPEVLGAATESAVKKLAKSEYTIAVLGDSMVDTLGPGVPHLRNELKKTFPTASFTILNYGVGASTIDYGITRLTEKYTYLGIEKVPLLSTRPDIVIVESFAYNHWENTKSDLDRHWLAIAKIVGIIKNQSPDTKIILSSTIAPHCATYTDGSANLPPERKFKQCETVKAYLQNMVNFATSQGYPLADTYHASLSGGDGQPKYINQGDHIHPSDAGKILFAQKVVEQIKIVL